MRKYIGCITKKLSSINYDNIIKHFGISYQKKYLIKKFCCNNKNTAMLKYNKVFLSDSTLLCHLLQTFNYLCHTPWKRQGYYILNHNKWVVQINKIFTWLQTISLYQDLTHFMLELTWPFIFDEIISCEDV